MSNWVLFVIIGQFLYAIAILIDRFIVTKKVVSKPIVYVFYVNFLSIFALGAIPFGVTIPSAWALFISFCTAVSFAASIYFLYESLNNSNTSEVVPVIGGVSAISAFSLGAVLLGDGLPNRFIAGFIILVIGMLIISHFRFTARSFVFLTGSGFFFGLSTILIKILFESTSFIDGFFWSRIANVVVALLLLALPSVYKAIRHDHSKHKTSKSNKALFVIGNKALGAIGFIFILFAIRQGNPAIINALTATQYIFLLVFALFFNKLLPEYFEEKIHKHEFLHKTLATSLIVLGFFVLFI